MTDPFRISAKSLGALAMPEFCPRCFWIETRVEELPFQMPFPGIFNSIDAYEKKLVHGRFDRHGAPEWLASLGDFRGYEPPPTASKFRVLDDATNILLTGSPDGVLVRRDGSRVIIDYKTAKFTVTQDELFPLYETQLNAYAHIGERKWSGPVSGLALIYLEPVTGEAAAGDEANLTPEGFRMGFSAHIVPVKRKPALVPGLLKRVRKILDRKSPPKPAKGCEDCLRLAELISLLDG